MTQARAMKIPECSRSCPPWEIPCMIGCPHLLPEANWMADHGFNVGDLDAPAPNNFNPDKRGFEPK